MDQNKKESKKKTCIILHGGAMKSAFAAGFVYGLAKEGIHCYDVALGVSSSVGTAAAVTTGQFEEMRSVWRDELTEGDFVSLKRLFLGRPIFDLDWLVDVVFRDRYGMTVERLLDSPTTFMTCGYNFKTDRIDFWTSKDEDFKEIAWKSIKSAMTLHPDQGEWIRGYEHTDADLVIYRWYEALPIDEDFQTLIISNHYSPFFTFRKRAGNWIFRLLQSRSFPPEVKKALKYRADLQKRGLHALNNYLENHGAVFYRPPKNVRSAFWGVVTSQKWLMRYYFDQGHKQARVFVEEPQNAKLVRLFKLRSQELESDD